MLERRPMTRIITRCALGLLLGTAASPVLAQVPAQKPLQATAHVSSVPQGEIRGIVADDKGKPLPGAVVSALGATTLFAIADADGRVPGRPRPAVSVARCSDTSASTSLTWMPRGGTTAP